MQDDEQWTKRGTEIRLQLDKLKTKAESTEDPFRKAVLQRLHKAFADNNPFDHERSQITEADLHSWTDGLVTDIEHVNDMLRKRHDPPPIE